MSVFPTGTESCAPPLSDDRAIIGGGVGSLVNTTADKDWQGQGTVLVVDDERAVRQVTARLISKFGFEVLTAIDGMDALRVYGEARKEIVTVVLDVTMPGMNGIQVLRALKKLNPALPVLLSSGYSEESINDLDFGGVGFVQKPFQRNELRESLKELLRSA